MVAVWSLERYSTRDVVKVEANPLDFIDRRREV